MHCLGAVASMYKMNAATDDAAVRQFNSLLENLNSTVLERRA